MKYFLIAIVLTALSTLATATGLLPSGEACGESEACESTCCYRDKCVVATSCDVEPAATLLFWLMVIGGILSGILCCSCCFWCIMSEIRKIQRPKEELTAMKSHASTALA